MIEGVVDAFRQCRTEKDFWRVQQQAEHDLTPSEFARLLEEDLPASTGAWSDQIAAIGGFSPETPVEPFERYPLADHVNLYSDSRVSSQAKRLIIAFCGRANQLMLPIPCMLQYLPSAECDVLVLRDPDREFFSFGVRGYAPSFLRLVRRLSRDMRFDAYRRVYCYGTSAGAFPALRAGLLLQTDRAIAIHGTFPWHISRLQSPGARAYPAFDPICACWHDTRTTVLYAYAEASDRDREEGEKLAALFPMRTLVYPDVTEHNLLLALATTGRLTPFFNRVFQLGRDLREKRRPSRKHGRRHRLKPFSRSARSRSSRSATPAG